MTSLFSSYYGYLYLSVAMTIMIFAAHTLQAFFERRRMHQQLSRHLSHNFSHHF